MMNSEKYHHAEDEYEVISQNSCNVFNLNIRHPYYTKDKDDEYFGKSTSVPYYRLLVVYNSVTSSRLWMALKFC